MSGSQDPGGVSAGEIDRLLEANWSQITRRAIHRTTRTLIWNRRLSDATRFAVAAAILLTIQMSWGVLTLQALHREALRTQTRSLPAPAADTSAVTPIPTAPNSGSTG